MKKQTPLAILEALEPFLSKKGEHFELVEAENCMLKFIDKDKNSDFYFKVIRYKIDSPQNGLLIDFKPRNKNHIANHEVWIVIKDLENYFSGWVKLLEGYDRVKSIYDDPIIEAFKNEYYSEFKIVDEDADIAPLNSRAILLLDEHLSYIEENIEKYKNEVNEKEILAIKGEVTELRKNLTSKSKAWVIKNLSTIWAKLTKQGTSLLKEFISEGKKELIKKSITFLIEKGPELISDISQRIQ